MGTTAEWTWLVYMAGDNNLEDAGKEDLKEMQAVGSTGKVNVLVQFDTEENQTTRYRVDKGKLTTLQTMHGVNCGDPKVLRDFAAWGASQYPAKHYLVDVWNHGGGWENLPPDFDYDAIRAAKPFAGAKLKRVKRALFKTTIDRIHTMAPKYRAIAVDCGSHDYLDNQELHKALAKVLPGGQPLDILGCDACLMNMLEIGYEMQDTANYMVGSEETEPGSGWPYADILAVLAAKPTMTPVALAKQIATAYGRWYRKNGDPMSDQAATQSTLDLGSIKTVADAVNGLAKAMIQDMKKSAGAISLSRDKVLKFETPEYVDLGDLCDQLQMRATNPAIKQAAKGVRQAMKTFVIANATWGPTVSRATGVSIYFPHKEKYSKDYASLRYSKQGSWRKFLEAFFAAP
jgi:hypothetical protein